MKNNGSKFITVLCLLVWANSNAMVKEEDPAEYGLQEAAHLQIKQVPTLFEICLKWLKKNACTSDFESLKNKALPEKALNIIKKDVANAHAPLLEGIFDYTPDEFYPRSHYPYNVFMNNDKSFSVKKKTNDSYIFTDYIANSNKEIKISVTDYFHIRFRNSKYLGMTHNYSHLLLCQPYDDSPGDVYWINSKSGSTDRRQQYLKAKSNNDKGFTIFCDGIYQGNDWNSKIPLDPKYPIAEHAIWVPKKDDYFVGLLQNEKQLGVFDPNTGSCNNVLNHNNQILCFEGSKDGKQLAALDKNYIKIWNPYTAEQTAAISHKLGSLFGISTILDRRVWNPWSPSTPLALFGITTMLGHRYSFSQLININTRRSRQLIFHEYPNCREEKFMNLSFSTKEVILSFIEYETYREREWIKHGTLTFKDGAEPNSIPYKSIYMWNIENGNLAFKKMKNESCSMHLYKLLGKKLSFWELNALITLEKQYQDKKEYTSADWQLLNKSQFESIRKLCKIRYLLPEPRPNSFLLHAPLVRNTSTFKQAALLISKKEKKGSACLVS